MSNDDKCASKRGRSTDAARADSPRYVVDVVENYIECDPDDEPCEFNGQTTFFLNELTNNGKINVIDEMTIDINDPTSMSVTEFLAKHGLKSTDVSVNA